jgi:hypothetical protein
MAVDAAPGRHALLALVGALILMGVVASACSRSTFEYVSSSDRKAYFKVPADWGFFDKRDILVASGQSLSEESNRQLKWMIGFDASPDPSVENVLSLGDPPRYPVILARVQELNFQLRDQLSLSGIRNSMYPVDQLLQQNAAEILHYEDVVLDGGLHGNRVIFDVITGGVTGVAVGNSVIRVDQTGIVDPATQTLYLFTIRCESHCFRDNKAIIDQIANSWTVKER